MKELYEKLPSSWDELKWKDFIKLTQAKVHETDEFDGLFIGSTNELQVISILTGASVAELEQLPLKDIGKLSNKLKFTQHLPNEKKLTWLKWKKIDQITYDDFVTYRNHAAEPFKNMALIMKAFSSNKNLTEEDILNMSTEEVFSGFFLLEKRVKKFIRRLQVSLKVKMKIQLLKAMIQTLNPFKMKSGLQKTN